MDKVVCEICGFLVNPVGHEDRCKINPAPRTNLWSDTKKKAWIGDTIHRLDIQCLLILKGVENKLLESECAQYTCNSAQATYYINVEDKPLIPNGTSAHSIATVFEASYQGDFRANYLIKVRKKIGIDDSIKLDHILIVPLNVMIP